MTIARLALYVLFGAIMVTACALWARFDFPFWSHTETGMASWYGREEDGKLTASGEKYNRHHLTAAHRSLPFNTRVKVTNRLNGRSVEVRITDRGPYKKGRILDVSEAAADELDMKKDGVVPVRIEVLPPEKPDGKPSP